MKKKLKGFTLVELIVVIAIIGVLAAILVPSLSGYVKKSRLSSANSSAKTAYNAVATFITDMETKGTPWDYKSVEVADCSTKPASVTDIKTAVQAALCENGSSAGQVYVIADESKLTLSAVQWRKSTTDKMVGQYPNPLPDVETAEKQGWGSPYTVSGTPATT